MTVGPPRTVPKLHSLKAGSKLHETLLSIAGEEGIKTAAVAGVGGVQEATLAYYNRESKRYEETRFEEFMEATSVLGNITVKDGAPFAHIHGNFGRRDLSVVGGHIVSATIFPLLEVTLTPTENTAVRKFDENLGLSTIYKF